MVQKKEVSGEGVAAGGDGPKVVVIHMLTYLLF